MTRNKHLAEAKRQKNDEFYTQFDTVERELDHYSSQLQGKIIYCNCDNYLFSRFFEYFKTKFHTLGLKKLIATNRSETGDSHKAVYDGSEIEVSKLTSNGDFRSKESIKILQESDVVVTNPPFSLFREYIAQLVEYKKDFVVLGNLNAVTYVDIFPLIRDGVILPGVNFNVSEDFVVPHGYQDIVKTRVDNNSRLISTISNIAWYTTLKHDAVKSAKLTQEYDDNIYTKYDNYDAIEVPRVGDIPRDYFGIMGVPVNFLKDYNPSQFRIVGSNRGRKQDTEGYFGRSTYIDEKETYKRIFIKRVKSM